MLKDIMVKAEQRMQGAIRSLEEEMAGIRTGRASPALVEHLSVEYYGTPTPLQQLATIAAPEPQMITIRPYDPSSLNTIEKGLETADRSTANGNYSTIGELKRRMTWNHAGTLLHDIYWDVMGGDGDVAKGPEIKAAIEKGFGSIDAWKADFKAAGVSAKTTRSTRLVMSRPASGLIARPGAPRSTRNSPGPSSSCAATTRASATPAYGTTGFSPVSLPLLTTERVSQ